MYKTKSGFTIVELLIVIVVIGILAAITIVAYNGIQNRAQSSSIQADLSNAQKKLALYQVDNSQFPTNVASLANTALAASRGAYDQSTNNFYYCHNNVSKAFAMSARTASGKSAFLVTSTSGVQAVASANGDQVCQAVGLTGYADTNGYFAQGFTAGSWASWVGN